MRFAGRGDLHKRVGAEDVEGYVEEVCKEGRWEEGEEGEKEGRLFGSGVVNYYFCLSWGGRVLGGKRRRHRGRRCGCRDRALLVLPIGLALAVFLVFWQNSYIRLLKLVTGVEISTRPVRRSGSDGKAVNRRSRRPAAAANRSNFRLSMAIIKEC